MNKLTNTYENKPKINIEASTRTYVNQLVPAAKGGGSCIGGKMILCRKFALKWRWGLYSEGV